MVLPCEAAMGLTRGKEIQQMVERATGDECPCKQGEICPLESVRSRGDLLVPRTRTGR